MTSRSQCDPMSLWNSSSFLALQNREEKQIARRNPLLYLACLQNTRKNSIVSPRDIADDPASLVFEAVEMIMWKLPVTSRPDCLKIFLNDWGDRGDRDDHMVSRL